MTPSPTSRGAGAAAVAAAAVAAFALASSLAQSGSGMTTIAATLALAWSGAAVLLARKRATHSLARLVAVLAAVAGAGVAALALLDGDAHVGVRSALAGFVPAAALHVLLAMPRGALASTGRRVLAALGWAGAIAVALVVWSSRPELSWWPGASLAAYAAVSGGPAMLAHASRGTPGDRRRIKWLSWGLVVTTGTATAVAILRALVGWPPHPLELATAATALVPLALALSTSEQLDPAIDRLLAATVSVAGLSALVGAAYLVIVLGLGRAPKQDERTLLTLSMVAAGIVALLYVPTRARLARFANRFVYGERDAPGDVIRSFGSRLSRAVPMDELLLQMAESLRKTMHLDAVEVWTGSTGRLERTVSDPDRGSARIALNPSEEPVVARAGVSGPAWMKVWLPQLLAGRTSPNVRLAPVTHSGDLLGLILVERIEDARPLTDDDERTLTELARQIGLALHNVQLDSALQASLDEVRRHAEALQASRKRIVTAADAERRRIERNLHDGAQQHLVALAVKARLARQLAESNMDQSKAILEELAGNVQETLDELRALAHGIYPPILADRGLADALKAVSARSPLPATVDADGVRRHPQEIEAAVYFCSLEALQNAAKYAGDNASARVHVWEDAGALLFEVTDNGMGFDATTHSPGAGFTNMSDRLGAIGGTLRVESAPGRGTKIAGTIPLVD